MSYPIFDSRDGRTINTNQAFELVRKHGFLGALTLAKEWRDMNTPGTVSFALHNAVLKQVREFATTGAMYRRA